MWEASGCVWQLRVTVWAAHHLTVNLPMLQISPFYLLSTSRDKFYQASLSLSFLFLLTFFLQILFSWERKEESERERDWEREGLGTRLRTSSTGTEWNQTPTSKGGTVHSFITLLTNAQQGLRDWSWCPYVCKKFFNYSLLKLTLLQKTFSRNSSLPT